MDTLVEIQNFEFFDVEAFFRDYLNIDLSALENDDDDIEIDSTLQKVGIESQNPISNLKSYVLISGVIVSCFLVSLVLRLLKRKHKM